MATEPQSKMNKASEKATEAKACGNALANLHTIPTNITGKTAALARVLTLPTSKLYLALKKI